MSCRRRTSSRPYGERGRTYRALPQPVVDAVLSLPTDCHPMDVLRTAVSVIGAHDPTTRDASGDANFARSLA